MNAPTSRQRRRGWRLSFPALVAVFTAASPNAVGAENTPAPAGSDTLEVVLDRRLRGDLVMAGNSNLLSAGGWRRAGNTTADVDGDQTSMCLTRSGAGPVCADNSSSAVLDIPPGARIVHARLYVETTLSRSASPIRVRLDGPGRSFTYTSLGATSAGVEKLSEATASHGGAVLRQAIWDVTDYVDDRGSGSYTVADIVSERAGAFLPYASWAIVAAYELDPETDVGRLSRADRHRFALRAVSWHDGFVQLDDRVLDVPIRGLEPELGAPRFAKSFHIVAHARLGSVDNLLFDGQPIGNNLTPGDGPPPAGVVIGDDPSCNSTTDVFNETICSLGTPVSAKRPGATAFRASSDGVSRSSSSGVDIDVIRIPDRYLTTRSSGHALSLLPVGHDVVAPAMIAVSIDLSAP
jgi:hypothetical protein